MREYSIPKATLGRLPGYLQYLRSLPKAKGATISATAIAKGLYLGEVQVRKDLAAVCGSGKPKIGYELETLINDIERHLGYDKLTNAVLVGAGTLGTALLGYDGFREHNFDFVVAFDSNPSKIGAKLHGVPVRNVSEMSTLVKRMNIRLAVLTVPQNCAQSCADMLVEAGIRGIWNFSPVKLNVPKNVHVENADLAAGLAALSHSVSASLN